MKRIVILGAGTAGTMMAARLSRRLPPEAWAITVVDRDDQHVYQPGLLFIPFGSYRPEEVVRPRSALVPPGVELVLSTITAIEADTRRVVLENGRVLDYDLLLLATGSHIHPEAHEGLTGPGWRTNAHEFYTLEGATALARALDGFQGGRLVVNLAELPIKCPVAPLEFLFLADAWLKDRGIREKTELVYATALDGAFTKPRCNVALSGLLETRNIELQTDFNVSKVDTEARKVEAYDGRVLDYDLFVSIPLHSGAEVLRRSGLTNDQGWVPTDRHTLQTLAHPEIFALGDTTDLPSSKAGSVAHFQAEVLTENILRFIEGQPLRPDFDGHANCFIETGHGKALLIDFNYTTEPLPGRFPLPGLGPFTLLEESRVNHWGKLGFRWVYWNMLLKGEDLPLDHRMVMAGKWA